MSTVRRLAGDGVDVEVVHRDTSLETDFAGPLKDAMVGALMAEDPGGDVVYGPPGHKQGRGADPRVMEVVGASVFASDVLTSWLYRPTGPGPFAPSPQSTGRTKTARCPDKPSPRLPMRMASRRASSRR